MDSESAPQRSCSSTSAEETVESASCYCRKPRNLFETELICNKCNVYFHANCLRNVRNVYYKKIAFNTNSYLFTCTNCSETQTETYKNRRTSFVNWVISFMAQMTVACVAERAKSGLIKKQFIPKAGTIFFTVDHVAKYIHEHWHLVNGHKKKNYERICDDVNKYFKDYPQVFKASPNYTTSFALYAPLYDVAHYASAHLHKKVNHSKKEQRKRRKHYGIITGDALTPPCPADKVPFTEDDYKYFAAEYDPHSKRLIEKDKHNLYYTFRFRRVGSNKVTLSRHDKAKELALSKDQLRVIGWEGYRTIRATHGVSRGTWYFEAVIENCAPKSCVRIGWSRIHAPLDCSLGYTKLSYGVRSKKGTKFHNSVGRTYYPPGFQRKDVIGVLIHLPTKDYIQPSNSTVESKKYHLVLGQEYPYFREKTKGYAEINKQLTENSCLLRSRIEYFVNGHSCGVAFEDLYRGAYFPSISLYGYESPPEVSVTFDSCVKYLPQGARPMSERVDEQIIELAVNEMIELIEGELCLPLWNKRLEENYVNLVL